MEEIAVNIVGPQQESVSGVVRRQRWSESERLKRALTFGAICWGVGGIAVFLPIIHFVLVPLAALAGPIVAWALWRQSARLCGGTGTCPCCHAPLEISPAADRWPLDELCTQCRRALVIERVSP